MRLEDRLSNDLLRSVERFAPRASTVDDLVSPVPHAPSGRHRASLIIVGLAIGLTPVVLLALLFSHNALVPSVTPGTVSSWILPTNPCALLTEDKVATATGANVLSSGLVPDSRMMIPGTPNPCEYKTDGKFGAVITSVRPQGKQEFLDLWARDPLNATPIHGLGHAAFMTGGTSIFVRVGDGYFSIDFQLDPGSEAPPVLRELATRALFNLSSAGGVNTSLSPTSPPPPGLTGSASSSAVAGSGGVGTLTGHLFAVGGPAPGSPRPLSGSVTITGDGMSKTVTVGADGSFSITLPAGRYELSGTSPQYNNGRAPCFATAPVNVQMGISVVSDVYCQEI